MFTRAAGLPGLRTALVVALLSTGVASVCTAGMVQGTVRAEGGTPVAGALVIADAGAGFFNAISNGTGAFSFSSGLAAGTYHIQASLMPYATSHYWGVEVTASGAATLSFTMRAGNGSISGYLVDEQGAAIEGATVDAWQVINGQYDDGAWGRATTDAAGDFRIGDPTTENGLPTGTYLIKAAKSGLPDGLRNNIPVVAGQETSGVALSEIGGTSSMLGTISSVSGAAIDGAQVYVDSPSAASLTTTDDEGNYGIPSLPAASYHVVVSATGYAAAHRYSVLVPDGAIIAGVDFTLGTLAGMLSGRVTAASSGLPISGAKVFADSEQGSGWGFATTGTDGRYTLPGLAPMYYVVHAEKSGFAGQLGYVTIEANATTGDYDFALGEANGAIAGQVTVTGKPAADAILFVNSSAGAETVVSSSCATRSDGTYSCENLSAGTYDVHVSGVIGYANQVRYFVNVADNSTATGVDFAIENGAATISGTVLDPDDEPLPDASVQAFLKENPGTWAATRTDDSGQYTIANMWGGNYLVTADYPGLAKMTRDDVPVVDSGTTVVNLPGDESSGTGGRGSSCDEIASVSTPSANLVKGRITSNGKVVLKGSIPGPAFTPSVDGMTFAIVDGNGGSVCAEIPASKFVQRRHGRMVLYKNSSAAIAGVRNIKLRRTRAGGFKFVIKGKGMALLTRGPDTVTFGFASGNFVAGGAAAMKSRGRKYIYP